MKDSQTKTKLVFVGERENIYTTSEVISEHSGNSRHAVQTLIEKYRPDFREFGRVSFEMRPLQTNGGVQTVKVYHLNEEQATLLMTYLKNTEQVRAFKKELVRQFYAMREIIWNHRHEQQTAAWQTARIEGKKARRLETDAIKLFVKYAKAQGSKRPEKYYMHFTKLANHVVGITPGNRDGGTALQLLDLRVVENVIDRAILNEISSCTEYHKAYQNVKVKVLQVAALALSNGLKLTA